MNPDDPGPNPSRWEQLAPRLRELPQESPPTSAPPGFATRVAARARLTSHRPPLARLRNWSLALAGTSVCALLIATSLHEPKTQFLPLPEPEFPTPGSK